MPTAPKHRVLGEGVARLLEEARAGSADALGRLLLAFEPLLLIKARAGLPDAMNAKVGGSDLAQSALLEAQRDFPAFRGGSLGEFQAWLLCILEHNVQGKVREFLRTRRRDVAAEAPGGSGPLLGVADGGPSPIAVASRREEEGLVRQAIALLDAEEQEVLRLRHHENLGWDEIARTTGRPSAGAAQKFWRRAVEKLPGLIGQVRRERRA
jgi:RNA polymerase sigma-70 factor, ECF subfamily